MNIQDYKTIKAEDVLMLKRQMNWPQPPIDNDKRDWAIYQFQLQIRQTEIRRILDERK